MMMVSMIIIVQFISVLADVTDAGRYLFNVLHLRGIAGLGIGLFVRIADGDDIVQFIVFGDVETVEEELCAESVSTQTIAIRLKIILFIFSQIYLQR